jgi:hypothetical protein
MHLENAVRGDSDKSRWGEWFAEKQIASEGLVLDLAVTQTRTPTKIAGLHRLFAIPKSRICW